jgi:hypothetical protein
MAALKLFTYSARTQSMQYAPDKSMWYPQHKLRCMWYLWPATNCKVFFIFVSYVIHLKVNQKPFCSSCSPMVLGHRGCRMLLISEHVIPTSPNHKVCDTHSTNCKVSHVVSICYFFLAGPDDMLCWVSQTIPTIEQNPKIWGQHMHASIYHIWNASAKWGAQSLPDVMSLSITDR